jgi:hypothetical protein
MDIDGPLMLSSHEKKAKASSLKSFGSLQVSESCKNAKKYSYYNLQ